LQQSIRKSASSNVIVTNNAVAKAPSPASPALNRLSRVPKQRRKTIPDKPNVSINLWSIMKNCIGKELSKIPMPVSVSHLTVARLLLLGYN
jgi:hypothetical protein